MGGKEEGITGNISPHLILNGDGGMRRIPRWRRRLAREGRREEGGPTRQRGWRAGSPVSGAHAGRGRMGRGERRERGREMGRIRPMRGEERRSASVKVMTRRIRLCSGQVACGVESP
uniref:Pr1-like protein n=1 Tax=Oryza sativa subsp. japonica TaxID=39947 RepID=Q69SL8_ORYSJ|nr:hypothetical protein [Oryza sativa Japonica Group]BAD36017.1 hypothetical protein [Oryza sativa Japonica Group]